MASSCTPVLEEILKLELSNDHVCIHLNLRACKDLDPRQYSTCIAIEALPTSASCMASVIEPLIYTAKEASLTYMESTQNCPASYWGLELQNKDHHPVSQDHHCFTAFTVTVNFLRNHGMSNQVNWYIYVELRN